MIFQAAIPPTQSQPPNVLLVVLDDIGNDRWPVMGECLLEEPPETPAMAELYKHAYTYPNYYTHPLCSSTRASILTGQQPHFTGIGKAIKADETFEMHPSKPTLPAWLADRGYLTHAVGKWHIDRKENVDSPGNRGFDFWDTFQSTGDYFSGWTFTSSGDPVQDGDGYSPEWVLSSSFSTWTLEAEGVRPVFQYVGLPLAHRPVHHPPKEWRYTDRGDSDLEQYVEMIEATDKLLGAIVNAALEARPNTWVFIVGDNGSLKGLSDWPESKGSMKEPGINVPLHIIPPGGLKGPCVDYRLTHCTDLFPTIAQCAFPGSKLAMPLTVDPEARALFYATPFEQGRHRAVLQNFSPHGFGKRERDSWAMVRADGWKIIRNSQGDSIYRVGGEFWDGVDLSLEEPARRDELVLELNAYIQNL